MLRRILGLQTNLVRRSFSSATAPTSAPAGAPASAASGGGAAADSGDANLKAHSDEQLVALVEKGDLQTHQLEAKLGDLSRAVLIRRKVLEKRSGKSIDGLPFKYYDYNQVFGACAENVIGYVPVPVGIAGPIKLDGEDVNIVMATTEGCLIASTHRGCKAITESGGATSVVIDDGMTRAPLIRMRSAAEAAELKRWVEVQENYYQLAAAFNSTSRFARLAHIKCVLAGRHVYLRFKSVSGDAMGMNMVSKGVEKVMQILNQYFPDIEVMSLSGNVCTDKKPSAINWLEGRGKSVICEATIKSDIVTKVLKTSVDAIVDLNIHKNYVGSAMAGSIGGFNAHASNIVTAIYIACGQDPAQNVESSNCITMMEKTGPSNKDLLISVTMPSIEVGTVGGGTHLSGQAACLDIVGVRGSHPSLPGANSQKLARVVASAVLAGELSLMAALAAGHLVRSHMKHNRKPSAPERSTQETDKTSGHTLAGMELSQENDKKDKKP